MHGRMHSREFKLDVVRQVESGAKRPAQVCRECELAESLRLRWRHEYAARGEAAFTPRLPSREQALEARIAALERYCGQLSLALATGRKVSSRPPSGSGTR
jgi:transposase